MTKIVTDSVSDIPPDLARELGITVLPLLVRFGAEAYRDGVDLSSNEFYQKLISQKDFPNTSVPSPGDIAQAYAKLAQSTDEILSIHLSSTYSAFYETALKARDLVGAKCRIEVIDSRSAIMGEGLLVIAAAKEAQKGASLGEIAGMVKELLPKSHVCMAFDTLEYPEARGPDRRRTGAYGITAKSASYRRDKGGHGRDRWCGQGEEPDEGYRLAVRVCG